jgi:tRNA-splicing ligase RtcB (3'-phosphate/5'-hydroxy nucleic acid ligase)
MNVDATNRVPIKMWAEADEMTMEQARHLANLPFAFRHIALMPDAHVGYGMPIGGVLAAEKVVIPNAVGVDIGCGMRLWRTGVTVDEFLPVRDKILSDIQRSVPTGFGRHQTPRDIPEMPDIEHLHEQEAVARMSIGTLGGGNHFIEVQKDAEGNVWAMLHSGSRNLGKTTCDRYNKIARTLNAKWHTGVPDEWQLAFLPMDSDEGQEYIAAMTYALVFANANRAAMQRAVIEAFTRHLPSAVDPDTTVDIHHNYAAMEHHFGRDLMVHRKGAVKARGPVIIPGSMGSASYFCTGLDNPDSFSSCSHGAGRAMGRKQACREISAESVILEMREADIALFKVKKDDVAEESRAAYKDIEDVMAHQSHLVRPDVRLTPLGVVKG